MLAYTRSLALELAARGVRVNCVCPGGVDTGMTQKIQFPDDVDLSLINRQMPLLPMARPDAIAGTYVYLASADAAHITGAILEVDGGISI